MNADLHQTPVLPFVSFNRLNVVRWWLAESDDRCVTPIGLGAVITTALLVLGEILLWLALPISIFLIRVHLR